MQNDRAPDTRATLPRALPLDSRNLDRELRQLYRQHQRILRACDRIEKWKQEIVEADAELLAKPSAAREKVLEKMVEGRREKILAEFSDLRLTQTQIESMSNALRVVLQKMERRLPGLDAPADSTRPATFSRYFRHSFCATVPPME